MKTSNNILLIGGAIAAYFLLTGKGTAGGGSGGSLSIPDAFGNSSGTGSAVVSPVISNTSTPAVVSTPSFQISPVILAAMTNPFIPNSVSFTESALNTKKATDPAVSSFLGGSLPSVTTSKVSIPAWMGGETFNTNINKLQSEGYTYGGLSPTGEFVFSKKLSAPTPVSNSNIPAALAGAAMPIISSQQGGATVYTQAKRASNNFGLTSGRTTRY